MSFIKDILLMEVETKIAETVNNEIKLENFELQAKEKNILELKKTPCKSKYWGFIDYTVNDNYLMLSYGELFDYLVKTEIIISKIDVATYFTADFVYTIPQPFIDQKEFQKRMNPENSEFPERLKCYIIHYTKLYDLLKNYKHNVTDEYKRNIQRLGEIRYKKSVSKSHKTQKSIKRSIKRSIKKGGKGKYTKNKK